MLLSTKFVLQSLQCPPGSAHFRTVHSRTDWSFVSSCVANSWFAFTFCVRTFCVVVTVQPLACYCRSFDCSWITSCTWSVPVYECPLVQSFCGFVSQFCITAYKRGTFAVGMGAFFPRDDTPRKIWQLLIFLLWTHLYCEHFLMSRFSSFLTCCPLQRLKRCRWIRRKWTVPVHVPKFYIFCIWCCYCEFCVHKSLTVPQLTGILWRLNVSSMLYKNGNMATLFLKTVLQKDCGGGLA